MSAFTKPFLVFPGGASIALERVPLAPGGATQETENWLQKILFESPESLPVNEIDPNMGPLIPVCMEIETGAGPADILFVTPTGQVVMVETKLWRNPQARREVVGQILDYAKQLTTWSYDVLDQKASLAMKKGSNYLLTCLKERYPDADEVAFVDGIGRSLSTGDFMLLIVGDGIRYGAESLVAFLEKYGHLRFGLGLVEVAAYRLPDGSTLLQPRILAKSELLQRTILVGPSGPVAFEDVAQAEETGGQNAAIQRDWFKAFWSEFLEVLRLDDDALVPAAPAKTTNQFFPMPPSGNSAWISAYIAQSSGKAGVYLTFAKAYERGLEISELLESDRQAIEAEVGARLTWNRTGDRVHISAPGISFDDLNAGADRNRVVAYLADMTQRMIKSLRPRLEAATANSR